jgi:hypothetical protein
MTRNANDITRWVEEHWVAVTAGYPCKSCGHTHHGRQLQREGVTIMHVAIQYRFCDDPDCGCDRLQVA